MDTTFRSNRAQENWKLLGNAVRRKIHVSSAFHTLRSMHQDILIKSSQLKILQILGEGAFALVEKSLLLSNNEKRVVAVKRMKSEFDEGDFDDFLKEIDLLKKLSHSGIVGLIGIGYEYTGDNKHPKKLFIVEEYCTNGTLKQIVINQMYTRNKIVYKMKDAFQWLLQIAKGLSYMHNARPMVIHRDIKLDNILLTKDPLGTGLCAKIADFGLSSSVKKSDVLRRSIKIARKESRRELRKMDSRTTSRSSLLSSFKSKQSFYGSQKSKARYDLSGKTGSLMYMAPEVYNFENYNEKVDVFSFGMIAYELLSRKINMCPFIWSECGGSKDQYVEQISYGRRPEIPQDWDDSWKYLLRKCWCQNPNDRFTMSEIIKLIEDILEHDIPENFQKSSKLNCCIQCCII